MKVLNTYSVVFSPIVYQDLKTCAPWHRYMIHSTVFFLIKGPISVSSYFFLFLLIFRSDVEFSIDDFNTIGGKVPLIANVKPHGKV